VCPPPFKKSNRGGLERVVGCAVGRRKLQLRHYDVSAADAIEQRRTHSSHARSRTLADVWPVFLPDKHLLDVYLYRQLRLRLNSARG